MVSGLGNFGFPENFDFLCFFSVWKCWIFGTIGFVEFLGFLKPVGLLVFFFFVEFVESVWISEFRIRLYHEELVQT